MCNQIFGAVQADLNLGKWLDGARSCYVSNLSETNENGTEIQTNHSKNN